LFIRHGRVCGPQWSAEHACPHPGWQSAAPSRRRSRARHRAATAAQVHVAYVAVGVALNAGDALVAPALPITDRVLAVPDVVQPLILARQAQLVTLAHIQVGAGYGAAAVFRRHRGALLEIDHERTGAVLAGLFAEHAETVIAAVAIHLADHRHQVMQVGFGLAEYRVLGGVLLASALLPALTLMTDHPHMNHMFPFDSLVALGLLARDIAAAVEIDPIALESATAIKILRVFGIDRPGDLFGFTESTWCIGLNRGERKKKQQKQGKWAHGDLDGKLRNASMQNPGCYC